MTRVVKAKDHYYSAKLEKATKLQKLQKKSLSIELINFCSLHIMKRIHKLFFIFLFLLNMILLHFAHLL